MKTCGYCGRENEDSAIVCRECGMSEFPETAEEKACAAQVQPLVEPEPEIPEPDVASGQEAALCPFCLFPNLPDRQWCKQCGSPFNATVLDPFQSAIAAGFMWRGLVCGRKKPIILCMAWLFLFPLFCANVGAFFIGLFSIQFSLALASIGLAAIQFSILFQVTRNFVSIPRLKLD